MQTAKRSPPKSRASLSAGVNAGQIATQAQTVPDQSQPAPTSELCFIRLREVLAICGKSRTSVYESIKKGVFPSPVKLGGRSSAWVKSEVMQWARNCIDSSRPK